MKCRTYSPTKMSQSQSVYTETLGVIGGIVTTSAILPQIYKSYKTRSTSDLSWTMFAIFYVGVSMNFIFGILINHPAIYLTASISFMTNTTLAVIKYRCEREYEPTLTPTRMLRLTTFRQPRKTHLHNRDEVQTDSETDALTGAHGDSGGKQVEDAENGGSR